MWGVLIRKPLAVRGWFEFVCNQLYWYSDIKWMAYGGWFRYTIIIWMGFLLMKWALVKLFRYFFWFEYAILLFMMETSNFVVAKVGIWICENLITCACVGYCANLLPNGNEKWQRTFSGGGTIFSSIWMGVRNQLLGP